MAMIRRVSTRAFLKRWEWRYISWSNAPLSYVAAFPCPECGGDAFEIFLEVSDPSEGVANRLNLDEYALWSLRWVSRCGHVWGSRDDPACVATEVKENGRVVGVIEPTSVPPWDRFQKGGARRPCIALGTLWQAEHATEAEFRRLVALRGIEQGMFMVTRQTREVLHEQQSEDV